METKECSRCHLVKPLDQFRKDNTKISGRGSTCKPCNNLQAKAYYKRGENARKIKEKVKRKYKIGPEYYKNKQKELRVRRKLAAFIKVGGESFECVCCHETNSVFLNIDHVNGGGGNHLVSLGLKGGAQFYSWILNQTDVSGFQILCFNCNFAKHRLEVCPHQDRITQEDEPEGS